MRFASSARCTTCSWSSPVSRTRPRRSRAVRARHPRHRGSHPRGRSDLGRANGGRPQEVLRRIREKRGLDLLRRGGVVRAMQRSAPGHVRTGWRSVTAEDWPVPWWRRTEARTASSRRVLDRPLGVAVPINGRARHRWLSFREKTSSNRLPLTNDLALVGRRRLPPPAQMS